MTVQTLNVLAVMLEAPYDLWYGLQLGKESEIASGTLYPILARLEQAGWLSSSWEEIDPATEGRPRRRLYRLTGEGADTARLAVDEQLSRLRSSQTSRRWGLRPGEQPS
jgi:PadR family transcriptional regulator PadR